MPIHEAAAMVLVMAILSIGAFLTIDSILSHRRKMAEIKHGRSEKEASLIAKNDDLRETVEIMQDRIAVLEQIAIDPANRTAEEIEKLR